MDNKSIYELSTSLDRNSIFYFTKVRNVKDVHRGTSLYAGIDFFMPEIDTKFIDDFQSKNWKFEEKLVGHYFDNKSLHIMPHYRVLIPSGIHAKLPTGYCMIFFNKGGVSNEKGLDVLACVADEDYQGELYISLVNTSNFEVVIEEGDKIIQGVLLRTIYFDLIKLDTLNDLYPEKTERGEGGFGSTGKK